MASIRSRGRFLCSRGGLIGIVLAVGAAALLQAQPKDDQPESTTQPATTQEVVTGEQQPQAAAPPVTEESGTAAQRDKERASTDPEPPREPSPTDILRELTKKANAPRRPVVRPTTPGRTKRTLLSPEAIPPNAIRSPEQRLLPDGYRIVDRPGRLIREGDYWVYSFESRGQGTPELPIRLLPNRLLEDMEVFSEGGTNAVVFVVSGEITEYHNINYLLIQKLLTRPDLGNFQ